MCILSGLFHTRSHSGLYPIFSISKKESVILIAIKTNNSSSGPFSLICGSKLARSCFGGLLLVLGIRGASLCAPCISQHLYAFDPFS